MGEYLSKSDKTKHTESGEIRKLVTNIKILNVPFKLG